MFKMSFYTILSDINKMECSECKKRLSGTRSSSMKRHYKLIHKKNIDFKTNLFLPCEDNQTWSDDETYDDSIDEKPLQDTSTAHYEEEEEVEQFDENINENTLTTPKTERNDNTYNPLCIVETHASDQGMPPRKKPKMSPNVNHNKNKTIGKYDWLGDLVVSQIKDIDSTNHADFAWDVQCLVRKYLEKPPKLPNDASTHTSRTSNDVTLPKGTNVSFNVNFI